jgi:thymidylate kinase
VAAEHTTKIISFSGIDGAGKSTQICALQSWLNEVGLSVLTLSLWNDVAVGAGFRETASRYAFRGDQGIGSPDNPLHRRDKNISSRPLTILRCCLYLADALNLRRKLRKLEKGTDWDVVIFDRYIYDELANLPFQGNLGKIFVRLLLRIAPPPDAVFLIDAIPEAASARKPEYPLDFLHRNRHSYLALSDFVSNMVVVHCGSIEEMERTVRIKLRSTLSRTIPDSVPVPIRR